MMELVKGRAQPLAYWVIVVPFVHVACLGPGEPPDSFVVPHQELASLLQQEVSPYEAITIRFEQALASVVDVDVEVAMNPVSVVTELAAEGATTLVVAPSEPWPTGSATVWVTALSTFGDELTVELPFVVRANNGNIRPRLLAPAASQLGPSNLKTLLVEAPSSLWPSERQAFAVTSSGGVEAARLLATSGPRALLGIDALVANATVAVSFVPQWSPSDQSTVIKTGTVVDERGPEVVWAEVAVKGPRAWLSMEATEPIIVLGGVVGEDVTFALPLPAQASREPRIELPRLPTFGARYAVEFRAIDFAGNETPTQRLEFFIPVQPKVHLQEIVSTPLQDWGDSQANGVPFDMFPGQGTVTDADEWVEIVNDGDEALDLVAADLELRVVGRSVSATKLVSAPGLFFGSGGNLWAWYPQEALVLRPRGSLPQSGVSIELWWGYVQLSRVRLGPGGDHQGGAPPAIDYGSLDRAQDGPWRWCSSSPGTGFAARACL